MARCPADALAGRDCGVALLRAVRCPAPERRPGRLGSHESTQGSDADARAHLHQRALALAACRRQARQGADGQLGLPQGPRPLAPIGSITCKNTRGAPAFKLRKYTIPKGLLKAGENVLAFAADNWGPGGVNPAGGKRQAKRLDDPLRHLVPEGARYLHGLYLDMPEAKDDIYRYLRW